MNSRIGVTMEVKEVEYLSKLSRIFLLEEEKEGLAKDLEKIKDFVNKINELETKEVKGSSFSLVGDQQVVREDNIGESLEIETSERLAPNFRMGHFVVPQVIE